MGIVIRPTQPVHLLCSKVKIVPLKLIGKMSMPRTELEATKLAVKVRNLIQEALINKPKFECFWSDSENVISWLNKPPEDFKVFVSNRVKFIKTHTKPNQWNHVKGIDSPADIPTRGCTPMDLQQGKVKEKWLHEPDWLKQSKSEWPTKRTINSSSPEVLSEVKSNCFLTFTKPTTVSPLEQYFLKGRSLNYQKLEAVMLQCLRFVNWKRQRKQEPTTPGVRDYEEVKVLQKTWPTPTEQALIADGLIKNVQGHYFAEILYLLQNPAKMAEAPMNKSKQRITQLGLVLKEVA